ncbi:hypothetical protein MMC07_000803 [Pseudocyphellaria aurata]|nr:hypothetical protein [Pseudocyphellaria aurata]
MRTSGLLALSVAAQQVAAHGWTNATSFSCPSNTDNHCTADQLRGFDWSGSAVGKDFSKYGAFDFSGFTCVNSFPTKRDALTPRTFQDKCIKGSVTKDTSTAPKISCGSGKPFSITDLQLSSSKDTDVEFVYGYENGDICKHIATCSKSGSTIKNLQCGGATSVTFKLPENVEHADCDIGIHRISFDCGPPSSPPRPPSSSLAPLPPHSASFVSIPSLSVPYSIPTGNISGSEIVPATGTAPVTIPLTLPGSSTSASTPAASSSSTAVLTLTSSPVASPPVVSPPISSPPASSSPVISTPALSSPTPIGSPSASSSASSSPFISTPASSSILPSVYPPASSPGSPPNSSSPPVILPPILNTTISSPPVVAPPASSSAASVPILSTPEGSSTPVSLETTTSSPPPGVTQPVVTTEIVHTTVTTCPVIDTITSGSTQIIQTSQTVSTVFSTVISTICTKCIAPPKSLSAPSAPASVPPSSPSSAVSGPSGPVSQSSGLVPAPSAPVSQPSGFAPAPSLPSLPLSSPAPAPSGPSQPGSAAPAPSVPSYLPSGPAPAPPVLPKCMNTWIALTQCKSNADSDCYCTNSDFTKNVQDCVSSWSANSDVIQSALSYLAGICAPHIAANPGIVTNVPSTITLLPVPVATHAPAAPASGAVIAGVITPPPAPASIPVTTISLVKTFTIPVTFASGPSAGQPIPASSTISILSTQVIVPQVKFTTETAEAGATGAPEIDLAAGRPYPVQAIPTGVAGPTAGLSTFATGTLPSGYKPTSQTSVQTFTGGAERIGCGIVGAMMVGAVGLWAGL